MSFDLQRVLESKRAFRQKLAARPVAEKLRLLDELRARALVIQRAPASHRLGDGRSATLPESGLVAEPPAEYGTDPK